MRRKLLRHKWKKIDGFRAHKCEYCGLIRYWDNEFGRIMYKNLYKIWYYGMPECQRAMHSDKVLITKIKKYETY